ncbi:MAG: ABC transporter ATP-binding protein [Clostridiales bacterium]|nr:ABC transporter ATP-binding protein [Clostridiales bacterium]
MIKRLAACVRQYKKPALLSPLLVAGEAAMEVLIPTLMASMLDKGIDAGDMGYIAKMGVLLVICALISLFFGVMAGRCSAVAGAGFAKNLRHDMFHRVQKFSFANIDKFSTASLITRLTTDVNNVQGTFQMIIRMAVRSPLLLIFSMVMALRISPKLSLAFLCVMPVLFGGLMLTMTKAHPFFEKMFKSFDKLNRTVQENLRSIRVVKNFVREKHEEEKFRDASSDVYRFSTGAEKVLAFNEPLMKGSMYVVMLLLSWFGARMIIASGNNPANGMTTGQLLAIISYAQQVLGGLMFLSMLIVFITISRAAAERIVEVLDEEIDMVDKENPVTEVRDGSIVFENVSFSYSRDMERLCLTDINLEIKSGQTVGILGGTGSSKSSLVQLIPRLYDVTAGSLKVGGVDVRDYETRALRDQVAMVLQKNVLFEGSIKENLRWGNYEATDEEMIEACKISHAHDFIMQFPDKYDTHIEQGGANVSGGQKQRLCIARALLKKPKILILDDSTSAVDTQTDAEIRNAFRTMIPNTTKLIIAQRVQSVQDADLILLLDEGRIVARGTHDELMQNSDIYREIALSQRKGVTDNV